MNYENFSFLLFLLWYLTGCVFLTGKHRPDILLWISSSSKRTKTSSSSSESSSSFLLKVQIVSKTLIGDIEEIHHRDTITIRARKSLNLVWNCSLLPEEASAASATLTQRRWRTIIREGMQSDSNYVAAKSLEGVIIDSVTKREEIADLDWNWR